jgi:hypothetical protein
MAFVPLIPLPVQFQDSVSSLNMIGGTLEFYLAGTSTPTNIFSDNVGTSVGTSIDLNAGGYPESGGNVITLFRDSSISLKIVGKNSSDVIVWTADNIEDALVLLSSTANGKGASVISVEDAGGYFAASDLEAVLQDVGLNYLKTTRSDTIGATYTFTSGGLNLGDLLLQRPNIRDYALQAGAASSSAGTIDYDIELGNTFEVLLTENITTTTISNPAQSGRMCQITIKITQDGGGGAYTVAWPASVKWPGGSAPVISTANDAVDMITLTTWNGGTNWFGNYSQAFA